MNIGGIPKALFDGFDYHLCRLLAPIVEHNDGLFAVFFEAPIACFGIVETANFVGDILFVQTFFEGVDNGDMVA